MDNNVVIGANVVVVKGADNAVVVGVPAKVVSNKVSKITQYFKK